MDYTPDTRSLTMKEAARLLGVSQQSIRIWDKKGKIKTWRTPGGQRRIPVSEIDRIKNQQHGLTL